jgi:hypothetical protein
VKNVGRNKHTAFKVPTFEEYKGILIDRNWEDYSIDDDGLFTIDE